MKFKIELGKNETPEQADELLEKALHRKQECSGGERYCDPAMNEAHDWLVARHEELLKNLIKDLQAEIRRNAAKQVR